MFKKNPGDQTADRRTSPRKSLEAMVTVEKEKLQNTEQVGNYSLTGLFFRSNYPEQYRPQDSVRVTFEDENKVSQCHTAKVVRTSGQGVGVRFRNREK